LGADDYVKGEFAARVLRAAGIDPPPRDRLTE
jgi:hypothetical protein